MYTESMQGRMRVFAPLDSRTHIGNYHIEPTTRRILFVGDIMLGRRVESLLASHGYAYPYSKIHDFLKTFSYVMGNFEGSIPVVHTKTADMTFRFSIDSHAIPALKEAGVTHVTLANNHAYDFGVAGLHNAREVLQRAGITGAGSPSHDEPFESTYIDMGTFRLAVIPLYAVGRDPSRESVARALIEAEKYSDMQIATVHWGDEYKKYNSEAQRVFAHELIDLGFDAIIGHHPHVVETIEVYKGSPIFYSLGNFIFDQYWNADVQAGLMVGMEARGDSIHFTLYPTESRTSVPALLLGTSSTAALVRISALSDASLSESISRGRMELPKPFLH